MKTSNFRILDSLFLFGFLLAAPGARAADPAGARPVPWKVGTPIVTYWCGPTLTDAVVQQMAEGGWNLVWCDEQGLDVAQRHVLRGQIQNHLLNPATLDDPKLKEQLDAFIGRVSKHPALYAYFITDEPSAAQFPALGKLVAYLRQRDPSHLAYINLFPTYANNQQLGTKGDTVHAYQEHLRRYLDSVKPALVSYDHYQFAIAGDHSEYFLNLAMIRRAALDAGAPFLNIVQASTWAPQVMRVPGPEEMRYLVYTTAAYGAQGISYYIYTCANHLGGIANADGTPTVLYHALKTLNREFVAIATELKPLRSLGVYHAGMLPPGTERLPSNAMFTLDPPLPDIPYKEPERVKGALLGYFGPAENRARATHAVVVNLDYKSGAKFGIRASGPLELFDAATGKWSPAGGSPVELTLAGGGGKLVRMASATPAARAADLDYPFFTFCIDWHDAKHRSFQEQAVMLKELGYPGVGHIWLDKVAERLQTLDKEGLKLFQITMAIDVAPGKKPYDPRFKEVLALVKGHHVQFDLLLNGMKPSDPEVDPHAVAILREMSDLARESGSQLLLYPHQGSWVERIEDACRVADKVDRPNVGVMFNLCHWLRVDTQREYKPLLQRAMPRLWAISISGADEFDPQPGWNRYIQPLDQGSFDLEKFLKTLKELGYKGPVGLQCFGIGGDAREHLARSMAAWCKLKVNLNPQ